MGVTLLHLVGIERCAVEHRTNTFILCVLVTFIGASLSGAPARSQSVPLEVLVDEADVIVQGKVLRIEDVLALQKRRNFPRPHEVAVVKVGDTLKGPPDLKEVRIAQPARGRPGKPVVAASTDIRFSPGQAGIWILKREAEGGLFWARSPSQFQKSAERTPLVKLLHTRCQIVGGAASGGLVARAEVCETGRMSQGYEVRFSLKNVSNDTIVVCNYPPHLPLEVDWIGPDGSRRSSAHYSWLNRITPDPLRRYNFVSIPPDGVLYLGTRGRGHQGLLFVKTASDQAKGFRPHRVITQNPAEPGIHQVVVRYTNRQEGRAFGLRGVWTGAVESNTLMIEVK